MTARPVKTQPAARFRNNCPLTELLKRPATRPASSDTQRGIGELRQESKEE